MKYWRGYLVAAIAAACSWGLIEFSKAHTVLVDMIYPYLTRMIQTYLAEWSISADFLVWEAVLMVLGVLYGYDEQDGDPKKKQLYKDVQALAGKFREECGSIICREILKNPPSDPNPTPRTADFYAKRPCARMVMTAAKLLDEFIAEHPLG